MKNLSDKVYYHPSGKWESRALFVYLFVGVPLCMVWAYAYSYALINMPEFFLGFLPYIFILFIMARVDSLFVVFYGKIRSKELAGILGTISAIVFLYVHWAVWMDLVMRHNDIVIQTDFAKGYVAAFEAKFFPSLLIRPDLMWHYHNQIGAVDIWDIGFKGLGLHIFWIVEASLYFSALPFNFRDRVNRPFCETENKWFDYDELDALTVIAQPEDFKTQLEQGDYSRIYDLKKVNREFEHSFHLLYHSKSKEYFLRSTNKVPDRNKKKSESSFFEQEVVKNIRLDSKAGSYLKKFIRKA